MASGEAYALMPVAEDVERDERAGLEAWRLQCLLDAGWKSHRAEQLAPRFDVDLHRAVDIVRQGCPQKTALPDPSLTTPRRRP